MLVSVSLILIVGMSMGWLCQKCRLPSLLGMLATGMVLGPYVLNLLDGSILGISPELRKMALIIILTRAGLGLDTSGLKKLGRPAVLMCFVPASFELMGVLLLAPKLMGLTVLEAAILGAVLAAVSPAVVVPRMVRLMDEGYGGKQGIPQLILAGASVDDVYVIVLFSTFVGMMQGESASLLSFVNIPVSILLGMAVGLAVGSLLACFFAKVHIRDTAKVLIILSISFLLVAAEEALTTAITFSALIAIMFIGIGLQKKREVVAKRLSVKYGKLWVAAEVFLFVLVGATVNIGYLGKVGAKALLLIVGALAFRMLGVFVCLLGTSLSKKERLFAMMAYTPKATVQAAIGGIPLALGFACGDTVLTVAVLAIVSIVVINNTIKITVFNRRKEIGIMKLVGATNGFIRFPFFVEGVTSGLISAGIASGIVCGAYYALCRWYAENPSNLSQMFGGSLVPLEQVWYYIVGGFVVLGFVLCGLGTATSIRKHLNV